MQLTTERINELAARNGVKKAVVVEYLLRVVGSSDGVMDALRKLQHAMEFHSWDSKTQVAIQTGILEHYKGDD